MKMRRLVLPFLALFLAGVFTWKTYGAEGWAGKWAARTDRLPAKASCTARLNDDPTGYSTIQAAVDANVLPFSVVKVAGYCSGVTFRNGVTQTVYLGQSLTLQGGYTLTNWVTPDPVANPTVLDAQGLGRVLFIQGDISVTVAGLQLTGGVALDSETGDRGGGIYAVTATLVVSDCVIRDNRADYGGGIYAYESNFILEGSTISGNVGYFGGGISLQEDAATLIGNTFSGNNANYGAAVHFSADRPNVMIGNIVTGNRANVNGAVYIEVYHDQAILISNQVTRNTAGMHGGGLYLGEAVIAGSEKQGRRAVLLVGNTVMSNTAELDGGGVYLSGDGGWSVLRDSFVRGNRAGRYGGGVYVDWSCGPTTIDGNVIGGNTAERGGGLFLDGAASPLTVTNNLVEENRALQDGGGVHGETYRNGHIFLGGNRIRANSAGLRGGGVYAGSSVEPMRSSVEGFTAVLEANEILSNTVPASGGGIYLGGVGEAVLEANTVATNTAGQGGGLYLSACGEAKLAANTVSANMAGWGGGLAFSSCPGTANADAVTGNVALGDGGGLYLNRSAFSLTNVLLADNQAGGQGSGLYQIATDSRLRHVTAARNVGGSAFYIAPGSLGKLAGSAALTNTIMVSHSVGVSMTGGILTVDSILWWDTPITVSGAPSVSTSIRSEYWGDPDLDRAGRIGSSSAAIDRGIDVGVVVDRDGDPRPAGWGYDLGADEYNGPWWRIYLPVVPRSHVQPALVFPFRIE